MSDILIRNVPFPKENEDGVILVEFRNGKARYYNTETKIETVVLPPHGRLIGADKLKSIILSCIKDAEKEYPKEDFDLVKTVYESVLYHIGKAQTVLEASE